MASGIAGHYVFCRVPSGPSVSEVSTNQPKESHAQMITFASTESLLGSIFFGLFLACCGLVVGYITCRRSSK